MQTFFKINKTQNFEVSNHFKLKCKFIFYFMLLIFSKKKLAHELKIS